MDVLGWSLFAQPVNDPFEETPGWTSAFGDASARSVAVGPRAPNKAPRARGIGGRSPDQDEQSRVSGFEELADSIYSSTESFPDWERLSNSDDFCDEERCHSLPGCATPENGHQLQRSNTVWYAQLHKTSENKDIAFKTKFLSAWTNVTNGWVLKTPTNFKFNSTICLLGEQYLLLKNVSNKINRAIFDQFKLDFSSHIWLTYRMDFPCLSSSHLTSDVGWGCMLRSGQMMLAQAFLLHFLGRDWRKASKNSNKEIQQIIRYFGDCFCDDCPFSIHKLVGYGHALGREAGDWFGPASICVALREAFEQVRRSGHAQLSQIVVYLTLDCTVYKKDVIELCTSAENSMSSTESRPNPMTSILESPALSLTEFPPSSNIQPFLSLKEPAVVSEYFVNNTSPVTSCDKQISTDASSSDTWHSVIILMPLRLGSETLNEVYIPCIKNLLESDLCIGIIGGRPKHSLYFIGYQDDFLIHLDPHCCQKTVDVLTSEFNTETFHCLFPRKLHITKMDPTCAIGFYCKTRLDFERLVIEIPKMIDQPALRSSPMFNFIEGSRAEIEHGCLYSVDTF